MSQWEKLLRQLRSMPKEMRFRELKKILEHLGYEMNSSGAGSHAVFRKAGKNPITIPKHEPIKRIYVELVRAAAEEATHE